MNDLKEVEMIHLENDVRVLEQENQSLKKENKILRENAEHNDKVVDKYWWENQLLKKKYENAVADYEYEHHKNQKAIDYINTFKITHNIDGDIAYLDEFHILASPKSLLEILKGDK